MNYKVLKKESYKISEWSGGITTELYIYPENSEYKNRDFIFRLSTATVEVEKSIFTKLENISRKLMILEGTMKLYHEKNNILELKKFDKDSFNGNDNTVSYGIATDFNLMTNNMCKGDIEHVRILKNHDYSIKFNCESNQNRIESIYNLDENVTMCFKDKKLN